MDAKVIWNGQLAFSGTANSGFQVPLDGDAGAGGSDSGFRPMELVAVGLAGCTAMDVISILGKKRQEVTAFEVRVQAEQAGEHPHVFTGATIEYFVTGRGVDEAAVRRSIELSATRYCPVQAMLGQIMPILLKYSIFEAASEGEPVLVKSGEYIPAQDPI
jgi:putative redox protein